MMQRGVEGKCSVLELTEQFLKEKGKLGVTEQLNCSIHQTCSASYSTSQWTCISIFPFSISISGICSSAWKLFSVVSFCNLLSYVLPLQIIYFSWNIIGNAYSSVLKIRPNYGLNYMTV